MTEDRQHELVQILNKWKDAVPLAVDEPGRARQKELADRFQDVRYRDGCRVRVTSGDGLEWFDVLSLGTRNGRINVVPCNQVEQILRDDANDPRVVTP